MEEVRYELVFFVLLVGVEWEQWWRVVAGQVHGQLGAADGEKRSWR